jgi:glycosyltransferase involved in cell wall biosynthesis
MHILLFTRSLSIGGTERQLLMLAEGLRRLGHEVAVVVFYRGGDIELAQGPASVRVLPLGKKGRWHLLGPLLGLRRILRDERPDALYAFLPAQTAVAALALSRELPTRLVFGIRSAEVRGAHYDALTWLTYRLEARLAYRTDLIIANSQAARADAVRRGMPADRIAVVPNGIDSQAMAPDAAAGRSQRRSWRIPEHGFVVGCVARLDPMKDHLTLLEAGAQFLKDNRDSYFVLVGQGPANFSRQLKSAAANIEPAGRFIWADPTTDMRPIYNAFDIATLSSAFGESFPNVVGEAMACGVPVAATDVGNVRQIIGTLGEVVPINQPQALCGAWIRLRNRLRKEPNLGLACRAAIVSQYGPEAMIEATERLLTEITGVYKN